MDAFTRYVLRQLAVGMVLVTAALTCVIWLSQSLRFIDWIVNRGLTASAFMQFIMLLLPNFLAIILPFALFTVIVFTYNKLVADRELVVMRAAGLSQLALARPALILAGIVMLVGYLVNLHLLPESYRMFREMQWDLRYNYSHVALQEGQFNTVSDEVTVYVRRRASDGQLHGILVHVAKNDAQPFTLMAERGALIETDKGPRVVMFNGNRQEVDENSHKLSILYFDRYSIDFDTGQDGTPVRYREPRERRLGELFNIEEDKYVPPRDYGKYRVEGHKRLTSPLSALGFALVGLACMISGSFSRRMQTRRIVLAVSLVVVMQAVTLGLENLCAKNIALAPLLYLNVLVPIVGGYVFLVRHPKRRPPKEADADAAPAAA